MPNPTLTLDPEQPYTSRGMTRYIAPDGQRLVVPKETSPDAAFAQYESMKAGGTLPSMEPGMKPPTAPGMLQQGARGIAQGYQAVRGGVGKALDVVFDVMPETRKATGMSKPSEYMNILPPDLTSGLAMVGLGAAGRIPGVRQLPGMLKSLAGSTLGAGIGGAIEEKDPSEVLAAGTLPVLVGEAAGKGTELTRRLLNNFTGALQARDAVKISKTLGDLVPSLRGQAKDAESLRDLVMTGKGKTRLFDRLEQGYDEVKNLIGGRQLYIRSLNQAMTFDEVRKELRNSFRGGFQSGPKAPSPGAIPSQPVMDARERFFSLLDDVNRDLPRMGPTGVQALDVFKDARAEFRKGINLIELLHDANGPSNALFKPAAERVKFQSQILQRKLSADEEDLAKRMGPGTLKEFAKPVFRGGKVGHGDEPGISMGRLFTRQPIGPAGTVSEAFPKLSFPAYVGEPRPFKLSPTEQTLLDLMLLYGQASGQRVSTPAAGAVGAASQALPEWARP